jgi:hypothetical protein
MARKIIVSSQSKFHSMMEVAFTSEKQQNLLEEKAKSSQNKHKISRDWHF